MTLRIRVENDPILKEFSRPIRLFDDNLRKFAQQMLDTMIKAKGIGIAANQVGEARQLIIVWDGLRNTPVRAMANPQVLKAMGSQTSSESCLSFPGKSITKERPLYISVKYQDLRGKIQQLDASGLLACCICHEIDHLRGITIA